MKVTASRAGFLTSVQDLGRSGLREFGVSVGGALDLHALRVANLLVGNDETQAGLEITFGGLQLRFDDERVVAWCGGQFEFRVGAQSVPIAHAAVVRAGEEVTVLAPKLGCRAWLSISGGIDVPQVLGSRSTDWRARMGGLEGRALREGDQIPLGPMSDASRSLVDLLTTERFSPWSPPTEWTDTADAGPILRFVRGKDWSRFTAASLQSLASETFTISPDSDRMGVRLEGPALKRNDDVDLVSEAVAPGTIQAPPNGKPIVLLGDCQTIGGYPKIAHVITVDLPIAAQLRAEDRVCFREISHVEAQQLLLERERDLDSFRVGIKLKFS